MTNLVTYFRQPQHSRIHHTHSRLEHFPPYRKATFLLCIFKTIQYSSPHGPPLLPPRFLHGEKTERISLGALSLLLQFTLILILILILTLMLHDRDDTQHPKVDLSPE